MMANPPLDQRLAQMLPSAAAPETDLADIPLEPMPGADLVDSAMSDSPDVPGTPAMDNSVQLAGPLLNAMLRKTVVKQAPKAERALVPEAARAASGEIMDATKAGRFKLIKDADPTLTQTVDTAVKARQAAAPNLGKPSPSAAEAAAGLPVEPFNLSRYQTQDAAAIVGGVADALGIKTKSVTFQEIKDKAAESGISEAFLSRLVSNDGKMMPSAVETYKALEVLESSANELDRLFKLVATGNATDVDKLVLRQQIAFHGLIQRGVKGIQTETARALAVFRIPRDGNSAMVRQVIEEYGGDNALSQMANSYLVLESRAAQNAMIEKSMMSGVKDVWFTTYINGLLSSPISHAKNIMSNLGFGAYQIPERAVASLYSNLLPQAVREGRMPNIGVKWGDLIPGSAKDKIAYDEALTMVQSLRNGFSEGLELASIAFKNNQPNDLMSKIEVQRGNSVPPISSAAFGIEEDKWLGKAIDYYGTAVTLPGRFLMAEDEFFKGVLYRMELNTQITRRSKTVYREAIDAGLPEAAALQKAEAEAISLFENPPRDLDEAASLFAQKGTFTADLPEGLKNVQKIFNNSALKIIVPFFKTPANIGLEVIERTPFAPLSPQWRAEMAKGGVYRDMALAKITLGTLTMATFAALANEGLITGSGPARKEDRDALIRGGWQPYSFKIGDKYYSYIGMDPISGFLAISSDYSEYAKRESDDSKIEEVLLGGALGFYEYFSEQPYLQGIADITKLLGLGKQGQDEEEKFKKGFNEVMAQFGGFAIGGSPAGTYSSLVAGIERLSDPTNRDTRASPELPMGVRGFVEAFNKYKSRVPYFNADLPETLTLWGDPAMSGTGAAYELVLPTRVTKQNFSEVDDLLARLGSPVGMPDKKIDGVELDAYQYNRLVTIYGKELPSKDQILNVMRTPGFDLMGPTDQRKTVQMVHSKFMDAARKQLKNEDVGLQLRIEEMADRKNQPAVFLGSD
jgi:hypothetical protein